MVEMPEGMFQVTCLDSVTWGWVEGCPGSQWVAVVWPCGWEIVLLGSWEGTGLISGVSSPIAAYN